MFTHLSDWHRLLVHDDPDDVVEVLHPPSCVRRESTEAEGWTVVSYDCAVDWHVDAVGLGWDVRHAFAPDESSPATSPWVLLPGVWLLAVEVVKSACYDCWGGYEYDVLVHVEPQRALTTGGARWYLATCVDCWPILPQPFRDEGGRDGWAWAHVDETGHRVRFTGEPE